MATTLRRRAFDAHFHIIDPRFPLVSNQGYMPEPYTARSFADQTKCFEHLDVAGGAIVSGSFQLFDQGYLVDAIEQLGNGFVGVTQLPLDEPVNEALVRKLSEQGVRAIRYNITRGVAASTAAILSQAVQCYALSQWHSEFYIDTTLLADRAYFEALSELPVVSIDHVGFSANGLDAMLQLLRCRARAGLPSYVKATGFGRYLGTPEELKSALIAVLREFPEALCWGSDLPSTRARVPFEEASSVELICDCVGQVFGDAGEQRERVLHGIFWGNSERLYRI